MPLLTARWAREAFVFLCVIFAAPRVYAVGDEIQVYVNDMNRPGEFGVEFHSNYVVHGPTTPSYPGELPSHHVLQVTPELAYGITKNLEAGMYFPPLALSPGGRLYENGLRLRLKFIADQVPGSHVFWGLNTEVGYSDRRVSEAYWNMELRPIVGYGDQRWLLSFNPILETALSGADRTPIFEPCLKISGRVASGYWLGLEHYSGLGPLNRLNRTNAPEHTLYAALDVAKGDLDVNFAVGHGLQNTEEKWLVKMIFALPL